MEDTARVLGCSVDTLERRFADTVKEGRSQLRNAIRMKQVSMALAGDIHMLRWVGVQMCDQIPKRQLEHKFDESSEEIKRLTKELAAALNKKD